MFYIQGTGINHRIGIAVPGSGWVHFSGIHFRFHFDPIGIFIESRGFQSLRRRGNRKIVLLFLNGKPSGTVRTGQGIPDIEIMIIINPCRKRIRNPQAVQSTTSRICRFIIRHIHLKVIIKRRCRAIQCNGGFLPAIPCFADKFSDDRVFGSICISRPVNRQRYSIIKIVLQHSFPFTFQPCLGIPVSRMVIFMIPRRPDKEIKAAGILHFKIHGSPFISRLRRIDHIPVNAKGTVCFVRKGTVFGRILTGKRIFSGQIRSGTNSISLSVINSSDPETIVSCDSIIRTMLYKINPKSLVTSTGMKGNTVCGKFFRPHSKSRHHLYCFVTGTVYIRIKIYQRDHRINGFSILKSHICDPVAEMPCRSFFLRYKPAGAAFNRLHCRGRSITERLYFRIRMKAYLAE